MIINMFHLYEPLAILTRDDPHGFRLGYDGNSSTVIRHTNPLAFLVKLRNLRRFHQAPKCLTLYVEQQQRSNCA
jgi:hypothetical protein